MRLKATFVVSFVLAFALFLAAPAVLENRPKRSAPLAVRKNYAEKLLAYEGAMVLCFLVSAGAALLIFRRVKLDYQAEARANMESLITGVQEDQSRNNH